MGYLYGINDAIKVTLFDVIKLQQDDLPIWLALKYKFERLHLSNTSCRPSAVRLRDQGDPHDDAHLEGENSAKRQKTSEHGTYVFGESSPGQDNKSESGPSTLVNQEQLDDFDFWMDSYATDDDELPTKKVSQELVDEMSKIVDEANYAKSIVIWERVHDFQLGVESYQQKVNLTTPTITFPGIEKYKVFSIVFEPIVLEGLKSYNNDVNHGYVTPSLSKEDVDYLQLFEEEIEERLKHRNQMRR
uniref:Uncharacterized protein n=1 Tax=Tanacetum cinerariifolium TaxID=118510 RepID=A0A6L2MZE5_TANCI|nr:hypothetical protein [Tanacetum cinerariifolium]